MSSRPWLMLSLVIAVICSALAGASPVLVFDFDCAEKSVFPEGKIRVELAPEVLVQGPMTWNDRAVSHDLNRDGKAEFFVPTQCGATGNCDWGVFAIDPLRSLGVISGVRIYIEDTGREWLQITTYTTSGAGNGFVSVYRMGESGYSEISSREIEDPEYSRFLSSMGEPFCRSKGEAHPNSRMNPPAGGGLAPD